MSPRYGTLAFRTMVAAATERPECGVGSRRKPLLGVRPGIDVRVSDDGMVRADEAGGMSVAPAPDVLPPHYRPTRHGGTSILPCWSLDVSALPGTLQHATTSGAHGVITNADVVSLNELQEALCSTARSWAPLPEEAAAT